MLASHDCIPANAELQSDLTHAAGSCSYTAALLHLRRPKYSVKSKDAIESEMLRSSVLLMCITPLSFATQKAERSRASPLDYIPNHITAAAGMQSRCGCLDARKNASRFRGRHFLFCFNASQPNAYLPAAKAAAFAPAMRPQTNALVMVKPM